MTTYFNDVQRLSRGWDNVIERIERELETADPVPVQSWQSTDAPQAMPELLNVDFSIDLQGVEDLGVYRHVIQPNAEWADRHFVEERISGHPKNPGTTWKIWPYARSAAEHRVKDGTDEEDPPFDHSYAERYWPVYAGRTPGGIITKDHVADNELMDSPNRGIRDDYGDLSTLLTLLRKDPLTRQAYLPIWFPEDLVGTVVYNRRVPCSLGYHFIRREDRFHCYYPMRSCDYVRHFRDDVYLTIRLQLHLLQTLRVVEPERWKGVRMGTFKMHMTSLHLFESDQQALRYRRTPRSGVENDYVGGAI